MPSSGLQGSGEKVDVAACCTGACCLLCSKGPAHGAEAKTGAPPGLVLSGTVDLPGVMPAPRTKRGYHVCASFTLSAECPPPLTSAAFSAALSHTVSRRRTVRRRPYCPGPGRDLGEGNNQGSRVVACSRDLDVPLLCRYEPANQHRSRRAYNARVHGTGTWHLNGIWLPWAKTRELVGHYNL